MRARRLSAAPDWQIVRERLEAGSEVYYGVVIELHNRHSAGVSGRTRRASERPRRATAARPPRRAVGKTWPSFRYYYRIENSEGLRSAGRAGRRRSLRAAHVLAETFGKSWSRAELPPVRGRFYYDDSRDELPRKRPLAVRRAVTLRRHTSDFVDGPRSSSARLFRVRYIKKQKNKTAHRPRRGARRHYGPRVRDQNCISGLR